MERRLNYRHEGKKVKEKPKNIKKTLIRFMPYLKNKHKNTVFGFSACAFIVDIDRYRSLFDRKYNK